MKEQHTAQRAGGSAVDPKRVPPSPTGEEWCPWTPNHRNGTILSPIPPEIRESGQTRQSGSRALQGTGQTLCARDVWLGIWGGGLEQPRAGEGGWSRSSGYNPLCEATGATLKSIIMRSSAWVRAPSGCMDQLPPLPLCVSPPAPHTPTRVWGLDAQPLGGHCVSSPTILQPRRPQWTPVITARPDNDDATSPW